MKFASPPGAMPFSPPLGQEVGMRFFERLVRAIFIGRERDDLSARMSAEQELREKISLWQHQATLYELAGLPRAARRCRKVANQYRVKLVAWVYRNEVA